MSNDKQMKNKEGLRFTTSTKGEPNTDTLMTSSTATTTPHRSNSDPVPGKIHEEGDADVGVVFHNGDSTDCYKCACVYWRHGGLPENGRMYINKETVSFKGILSTKLSFNLDRQNLGWVVWLWLKMPSLQLMVGRSSYFLLC